MNISGFERGVIAALLIAVIALATLLVGRSQRSFRTLVLITLTLTVILVPLGAYVRLSDAGLGCPDWPGCYGNLTPLHAHAEIGAAEASMPGGPVSMAKAWKEMVHRYLAMIVGSLIAGILICSWRNSRNWKQSSTLPIFISLSVLLQAALGAWTVTMLLKPAIVTAHLIGGMTILGLLAMLLFRQSLLRNLSNAIVADVKLRLFGRIALGAVAIQIVLGGWVSTNYAALACQDFPLCNGSLWPQMEFQNAFHVIRPLGVGPDGELLGMEALRAIHWTHRIGALIVTIIAGTLSVLLMRSDGGKSAGQMLASVLALQIGLGAANVWFSLPLVVAVAHNAVAAFLLLILIFINLRLATR